jgi:hypothetical protein
MYKKYQEKQGLMILYVTQKRKSIVSTPDADAGW